ncbi:MAG: HAD family hydrolase [Planctomycetes bacterium]|nr:HAD family hydrolase [Planctomycetota bacterium]
MRLRGVRTFAIDGSLQSVGRDGIDALFIDFYGTIAAGDRAAVEATCQHIVQTLELPMTAPAFAVMWGERFFATIDASNHDDFRMLHDCETISLAETLSELGLDVDPHPLVGILDEYWHDPPMHADVLRLIETLDLPICCVSNADTIPLTSALEKLGLGFAAVITSEDARCYKPDPAIFAMALDALGVDASRVVHVGDSVHSDVGGAIGAGITAIWLRRDERIHDVGRSSPDHTISSLAELPDLLGR